MTKNDRMAEKIGAFYFAENGLIKIDLPPLSCAINDLWQSAKSIPQSLTDRSADPVTIKLESSEAAIQFTGKW